MPSHDLNVTYTFDHSALFNTLLFAQELGYDVVALTLAVTGKLPSALPAIPAQNIKKPESIQILTRLTLTVSDTAQNHRLPSLTSSYDIVALRPTNEKTLQQCCSGLDCDLISIDFSQRLPFILRFTTVASALQRGVRFEICYSSGIVNGSDARRNLISGATQLIRATRGRGIVVSSEAKSALGLRGVADVINLAHMWGLSQERGREAVCEEAGRVVRLAKMKRTSYRGVVDIVDGGKQVPAATHEKKPQWKEVKHIEQFGQTLSDPSTGTSSRQGTPSNSITGKRKAPEISTKSVGATAEADTKPISKREMKRRAKRARLENN